MEQKWQVTQPSTHTHYLIQLEMVELLWDDTIQIMMTIPQLLRLTKCCISILLLHQIKLSQFKI